MKRLHVHVSTADLGGSVRFYERLFGAPPTRREHDYAQWLLEDPRVNFALSSRGHAPGLDHFGLQVESAEELAEVKARFAATEGSFVDQGVTECCYARSDKAWAADPQGIAWEGFRTTAHTRHFGQDSGSEPEPPDAAPQKAAACCVPLPAQAR